MAATKRQVHEVVVEVVPGAQVWRKGRMWEAGEQLEVKGADAKALERRCMVRRLT